MSYSAWVLVKWLEEQQQTPENYSTYDIVHAAAVACEPRYIEPGLIIYILMCNGNYRRAQILLISESKRTLENHKLVLEIHDLNIRETNEQSRPTVKEKKKETQTSMSGTSGTARNVKTQTENTSLTPKLLKPENVPENLGEALKTVIEKVGYSNDSSNWLKTNDSCTLHAQQVEEVPLSISDGSGSMGSGIPLETTAHVSRAKTHDDAVTTIDEDKQTPEPLANQIKETLIIDNIESNQTIDSVMDCSEYISTPGVVAATENIGICNISPNQTIDFVMDYSEYIAPPDIGALLENVGMTPVSLIYNNVGNGKFRVTKISIKSDSTFLTQNSPELKPNSEQMADPDTHNLNIREFYEMCALTAEDMKEHVQMADLACTSKQSSGAGQLVRRGHQPSMSWNEGFLAERSISETSGIATEILIHEAETLRPLLTLSLAKPKYGRSYLAKPLKALTEKSDNNKDFSSMPLLRNLLQHISEFSGSQNKERHNIEIKELNQTTDSDLVPIGQGNAHVPASLLASINWSSYMTATRLLLEAIFTRNVLETYSLSEGQQSGKKSAKKILSPLLVDDIVDIVSSRCYVSKSKVRHGIAAICKSEKNRAIRRHKSTKK